MHRSDDGFSVPAVGLEVFLGAKKETADPSQRGYFFASSRPLASLAFILPMLGAYEGGILALGPDAVHNGAAVWLQNLLRAIGLGQYVLLPVVTCALLLGWHYLTRQPWRFPPWILAGMLLESVVWALALWLVYRGYCVALRLAPAVADLQVGTLLGYCGAGIYEELLFRVLLLSGIAAIVRAAGAHQRASQITAIAVSALIFAAAHYRIFVSAGIEFTWAGFVFHFLCGICFGVLFVLRGFGVTAGTHALYNVLVVVLAG